MELLLPLFVMAGTARAWPLSDVLDAASNNSPIWTPTNIEPRMCTGDGIR
jgi:hypothetical protein